MHTLAVPIFMKYLLIIIAGLLLFAGCKPVVKPQTLYGTWKYTRLENPNAYFGRPRFAGYGNEQTQTKFLQNAAFARVKQLTLGYTLPHSLLGRWNIQRVRAYVTGANLITFTSLFKGFDPEIVNYQGGFQTYPINKSVSFGLQVTL